MLSLLVRRVAKDAVLRSRVQKMCTASKEWQTAAGGLRVRTVSLGEQGDAPVESGQTVRVEFAARLDDGSEVAHAVKSFKLGSSSVCAAIDQSVVGMRVGDRKKLRAPTHMSRGPLLADVPRDAVRQPPRREDAFYCPRLPPPV